MRWLVTLGLAAGCYNPTVSPGAPCESACPGDLVCVDHVCRAPGYMPAPDAGPADSAPPVDTPDAPPGDVDADGITDDVDNCPADANADQHDEDGDAIGDTCDPCPHLAGTAVDGDGDGVGDACDPEPAIAKQQITFFDPFTSDRPEWSQKDGFSRVGETLRLNGGYAGAVLAVANAETRIVAAGTIVSIVSGAPEHQIAINVARNDSGDVYHYTEFYDTGGSAGDIAISRANAGVYSTFESTQYTGVMPTGAWSMAIDSSVAAQHMTLATTLGGTTRTPLEADTTALVPSSTMYVYVAGADVRLDYLIVIETLP